MWLVCMDKKGCTIKEEKNWLNKMLMIRQHKIKEKVNMYTFRLKTKVTDFQLVHFFPTTFVPFSNSYFISNF